VVAIHRPPPLRHPPSPPTFIAAVFDTVPPLYEEDVSFEAADAATWLTPDDIVIGYADDQDAWAFPLRILNYHELINATLNGTPVLVSYCPLCYSGALFSRQLADGRTLTFGNSGAFYANDVVMVDHETGSYWYHIAGQAIVGPLTGQQLDLLPSNTLTWREWRTQHPNTRVLARPAFNRPYEYDPFLGLAEFLGTPATTIPMKHTPQGVRMPTAHPVLVLTIGDQWWAYPLPRGETPQVWHDTIAGTPLRSMATTGATTKQAHAGHSKALPQKAMRQGNGCSCYPTASRPGLSPSQRYRISTSFPRQTNRGAQPCRAPALPWRMPLIVSGLPQSASGRTSRSQAATPQSSGRRNTPLLSTKHSTTNPLAQTKAPAR